MEPVLSNLQRKIWRAIKLAPQASNNSLAQMLGCSIPPVASLRAAMILMGETPELTRRVGIDGRSRRVPVAPVEAPVATVIRTAPMQHLGRRPEWAGGPPRVWEGNIFNANAFGPQHVN
ncbi:MAG: hypothetical protein ACLPKB_05885 [Xanthobacteraceae bacterium]